MLVFALLFATAANGAAPVVGPEIAWMPVAPFPGFQARETAGNFPVRAAAPLATDGDGFVLAFTTTEGGKARSVVTRLDSHAQPVPGTTRQIAPSEPYYDAVMPEIVAAPDGFFLAQTEVAAQSSRIVVWHLDRVLKPDPAPFSIVPFLPGAGLLPPGIVRVAGDRVFVVADRVFAEYDLAGVPRRTAAMSFSGDDAAFAGGTLVTAGSESLSLLQVCSFHSCNTFPAHLNVFVSFDGAYPLRASYGFYSGDRIAVAADGSTVLYVFDQPLPYPDTTGFMSFLRLDAAGGFIDVEPRTFGTFDRLPYDLPQRPSVASDGNRFVAVWRIAGQNGQHAIGAAAIDRDGTVTPIAIPNLGDETLPFVFAAGPNRFLVSYLSGRDGEHRLAGRFITFGGRRPAVRR